MTNIQIDREGAFRGKVLEKAVGQSKGGFPQLMLRLSALEMWEENAEVEGGGQWVDWSEYGQSMLGYFVLYNDSGPLLNAEQVQKALGWAGDSFAALDSLDVSEKTVMFRVADHEYNGKNKLQIEWIDAEDAPVTRTLTSLDAAKLTDLDKKFGLTGKKPTPVKSAPKPTVAGKAPAAPAKPAAAAGSTPAPSAPATTKPAVASKPALTKPPTTSKPPAKPAKATTVTEETSSESSESSALPAECTKDAAWEYIFKKKNEGTPDDDVANAFMAACDTVGKDDEADFTTTDWAAVRDHAANALSIVPFA